MTLNLTHSIEGGGEVFVDFNVMPGRPVRESFHPERYEVTVDGAVCHFSREYASSMKASPSHVIFLTMLAHYQRLAYLTLAARFGFEPSLEGDEVLKLWPTDIQVNMPCMAQRESDLSQHFILREVRQKGEGRFVARGSSWIIGDDGQKISIEGRGIVVLLKEPAQILPMVLEGNGE